MVSKSARGEERGIETTYEWACPVCETLNDGERSSCRECEFTTASEEPERSRVVRWATAAALGAVAIVGGLTVLVVGVRSLGSELVPLPVITGLAVATLGMNLAVDSLDW